VEHGHTPGERLILQALWTKAAGNDRQRTIRIGYDRLANIASVNWKTARACLRSLEKKLAIETLEPEDSNSREGRLYRIYGFDLILERRKQAGLEWVQKGRGVEFLQPGTVPFIGTVPSSTTVPSDGTETPPDNGTETVPATGGETVPATGAPLRTSKEENEETTTTAPLDLLAALEALIPEIDAGAASRIWEDCREAIPDVTPAEVAYFFGKRLIFLPTKRVDNPTGLMIATVRDWITPRKVHERREALAEAEERRRQDEAAAAANLERLQAELALTRSR
jgi:hypothetical protein